MYDVFISYRRKLGFAVAKMISELLKAKGMSAFVDLDELRNGTFDDKILDAIEATPSFILVLTPGSLDRCGEEGDWLTREINTAIETGRNIIPILCEGFEWPRQWDNDMSDNIKMLSHYNSVIMSYEYVDAMVDKIIEYVRGSDEALAKKTSLDDTFEGDIDGFFMPKMKDIDEIEGVDFAFHAGSVWHQDIRRIEILSQLAEAGKKIRVLVNREGVADSTSQFMRHKLKRYMPFDEAIASWKHIEESFDNVEVRVCDIPLLRIYYSFNMKNKNDNVTRIKFYTHGNANINSNFSKNFFASESGYELFRSEFEFLWEKSKQEA